MDFVRALINCGLRALGIGVLLYAAVAVFAPDAEAAVGSCPINGNCDQGEAYAACLSHRLNIAGNQMPVACTRTLNYYYPSYQSYSNSPVVPYYELRATFKADKSCAARNVGFNTDVYPQVRAGVAPECVAGCKLVYEGLLSNKIGNVTVASSYTFRQYIGDVCGTPEGAPSQAQDQNPQLSQDECKPAPGGQTFCVTPDNKQCHTTSNGKRICWSPNETGEKTDGVDGMVRTNDGSAPLPSTPTNDGSDWKKVNQYNVTNVTNTSTTTITVGTHVSDSSKPAKPTENPDITEPGGGTDPNGNSATPASDCANPPQCAGEDAIGCAMLRQHHSLNCREGSTTPTGIPDGDPESSVTKPVNTLFTGDNPQGDPLALVNLGGWQGVGQCPIALQFSVMGRSFTLDESQLCSLLDALRALINLLAAIHAGFIVLGGSRR